MQRIHCPQCGLQQPTEHLFCVRCGRSLPSHLLETGHAKRARFFAGTKVDERDPEGGFLRVSCYRKDQTFESAEGSVLIPGHHVRFSIWICDEARCVLSIPETEARDLARFLEDQLNDLDSALPLG